MPEEGEKKPEDILKKLEDIVKKTEQKIEIPPYIGKKPQYISALETELINQTLQSGEYIKVPLNPFTEEFSELAIFYFLAEDGILKKYPNLSIIQASEHESSITNFIDVLWVISDDNGDLFLVHPKSKPWIYIINVGSLAFKALIAGTSDMLPDSIDKKFNPYDYTRVYNKIGMLMLLTMDNLSPEPDDILRLVPSFKNVPWNRDTIKIDLQELLSTSYEATIYYKRKDDYILVFVPNYEIATFYDFVIANSFKEKKIQ